MFGSARFCLALLLAGCAAQPPEAGGIPPVAVADARPAPRPLPAQLTLPPGPGPHPVVIVLHGCGGISSNTRLWANRLVGWGYGALVVDSLAPRGLTSVCDHDQQRLLSTTDRAGDGVAAARWLQGQPGVDGARIAVIGESHGGGTAVILANHPFTDAAGGQIKAAIDYYGPCRNPPRYGGLPLLVLAGEADTWSDPVQRCTAYRAAQPPGSPITVATYPGAVHGFDNPRNKRLRFLDGHPLQYDAPAADDSIARVHAFLAQTIGPGG